jgi:hypothetical protein
LFDLALLGEELLERLDKGIRIVQRLGDSFLFRFSGWESDYRPSRARNQRLTIDQPARFRLLRGIRLASDSQGSGSIQCARCNYVETIEQKRVARACAKNRYDVARGVMRDI